MVRFPLPDSFGLSLWVQGGASLLLALVCGLLVGAGRRGPAYWVAAWLCFALWCLTAPLVPFGAGPSWLLCLHATWGWWHAGLFAVGAWLFRAPGAGQAPAAAPRPWAVLFGLALLGVLASLLTLLPGSVPGMLRNVTLGLVEGAAAVVFVRGWWRAGPGGAGMPLLAGTLGVQAVVRWLQVPLLPAVVRWLQVPLLPAGVSAPLLLLGCADAALLVLLAVALLLVRLDEERGEQRTLRQRLALAEDHFRLAFEQGSVGMALLTAEGRPVRVNEALAQMLGYTPEELRHRRLADLAHPQERGDDYGFIRQAVQGTGLPNASPAGDLLPAFHRERRFLHKDGRTIWLRIQERPVAPPEAAGVGARYQFCVLTDVSERKRAEEALLADEIDGRPPQETCRDLLAQVFETADALIVVLDPAGRILRFNRKCEGVTGYREAEVRGRVFWEFLVPERFVAGVRDAFGRLTAPAAGHAAAEPHDLENAWRTRAGAERRIAWRSSAALDGRGQVRCVIGIGLDVTEQRRLEDHLARARKMETLAKMIGGIAHDFNNQLTAILGNLSLVLADFRRLCPERTARGSEPPALHPPRSVLEAWLPAVAGAEQAAQRCARMTARLLVFSRGRVGPMRPRLLDQVVSEAVRLLQPDLPPSIRVEFVARGERWPVEADVTQLHELLVNLATNARNAMPDGGTLTLAVTGRVLGPEDCAAQPEARPGPVMELLVQDTGHGMTPEVLSRLFEPFFTTRRTGPGSGLGLAVVFGIVKGHGGWITVESTPGVGTAFRLCFPAKVPAAEDAEPAAPSWANGNCPGSKSGGATSPGGQETILVVDDEPLVRDLARAVLERSGFRVLTADDGADALREYRAQAGRIDLILLDYTMPQMTGLQVMQALRAENAPVKVVLSSGYVTDGDVEQFLATGARAFVPKPYLPQQLVHTIRKVLAEAVARG
jgi:PAS domain S-box-containing protein